MSRAHAEDHGRVFGGRGTALQFNPAQSVLESAGDTVDGLLQVPRTLAQNHRLISACPASRHNELIHAIELEALRHLSTQMAKASVRVKSRPDAGCG